MPGRSALQAQMSVGDRYRLVRRIGADTSVETWEAFDTRLDRPVALRLLAEATWDDPDARAALRGVARDSAWAGTPAAAPRVLDGGDDPTYGPFVVAELNAAFEATQRIPTTAPGGVVSPPAAHARDAAPRAARVGVPATGDELPRPPAAAPRAAVTRGGPARPRTMGPLALALVLLAACALVGVAYAARSLEPTETPAAALAPTPPPTARPATPGAPPTLAAGATRPNSAPTPAPAANATAGAPTPAPTAAAPPATAGSPVETIKQHYALIDARRYTESYQLMDARLRAENSQATYNGWFAGKVSLKPVAVDLVSQNAQQATVRATVLSTDVVNGRNVTSQVTEQFALRPENGAWRIDTVTRQDQRPVNGRHSGANDNADDDNGD